VAEVLDVLGGETGATWVAALATIVVLGGLAGERRAFAVAQHLFAGMLTGYLALLAIREVLVPRLVEPLLAGEGGRLGLWILLLIAAITAAAPWLPRIVAAVPISLLVGSIAAFALGGALVGTALPQAAASIADGDSPVGVAAGLLALVITVLVLIALLHARPSAGAARGATAAGRWLLVAGLGGWLGFLLVSRLALLIDRVGFLIVDWLGVGR
jgi:hypothetical protein